MGQLKAKFFAPAHVQETLNGAVDGTNQTFTLSFTPVTVPGAFGLFMDGLLMQPTIDYNLSGQTVTMVTAPSANQTLFARYIQAT